MEGIVQERWQGAEKGKHISNSCCTISDKGKTLEKVVNYKQKLYDVEELIYENLMVCRSIVSNAMQFYEITQQELDEHMKEAEKSGRAPDRISVGQTLKHFVRDWADDGSKERKDAFPCILSTLSNLKSQETEASPLKVLLPGSGLGRLSHEVSNLGGKLSFQ